MFTCFRGKWPLPPLILRICWAAVRFSWLAFLLYNRGSTSLLKFWRISGKRFASAAFPQVVQTSMTVTSRLLAIYSKVDTYKKLSSSESVDPV